MDLHFPSETAEDVMYSPFFSLPEPLRWEIVDYFKTHTPSDSSNSIAPALTAIGGIGAIMAGVGFGGSALASVMKADSERGRDYEWWKHVRQFPLTGYGAPLIPITRAEADFLISRSVYLTRVTGEPILATAYIRIPSISPGEQTGLEGWVMFDLPIHMPISYATGQPIPPPPEVVEFVERLRADGERRMAEFGSLVGQPTWSAW